MSDETVIAPKRGPGRKTIGKYRIEGILGEGAMGLVYAGRDPDIDRPVAIKTIHKHLISASESQDWLERFAREARAAGRVLHPNLVTVFDFLQEDGLPYLVMERVRSITLEDRLVDGKALPTEEIHAIVSQILAGLHCIHGVGIVHRDLKPANVMLAEDGTVKLTDFGVARFTTMDATGAGMIGTPAYMAPEQLTGQEVDARADIYACGVVLYELLTGRKPYKGGGVEALFTALRDGQIANPSEIVPSLSTEIDAVVAKAMSIEAVNRYPNAQDMRAALVAVLPSADHTGLVNLVPNARPQAQEPGGSGAGTMIERMSAQTLNTVEKQLMSHIGPMGKIIVRRAAARASSPEDLIEAVLEEIADGTDRDGLRTAIERAFAGDRSQVSQVSASGIPEDTIRTLADLLTPHLGPIARVLAGREAKTAASADALVQTLAAHIPDDHDRQDFLRAVKRTSP
ncbi:serine/threonine-protein kinase [Rhodospirillum sp. A1_3_36]|uniref:serine/threonine-protein kinase n=1 Tax=Rhodospirillum sp. A1_3_36 TaxID=3391666 RepID=UPI0039A4AF3E